MTPVFVYGLLKPGFSLHHVAAPYVKRVVEGRTRGRLYDADVPAARFDEDGCIEGFVMWVADEALAVLDDVEDEGVVYRRVEIDVETDDAPLRAHAYEYLRPLDGCSCVGTVWPAGR